MVDNRISEELKQFILQHFHSIEEVEVLILLRKDRGQHWSSDALSRAMTSSVSSIEKRLSDLCNSGFVECLRDDQESRYRYQPKTLLTEGLVNDLALAYPELRLRIAQLIYEAPIERIRNFADAFKLKEDKDHG